MRLHRLDLLAYGAFEARSLDLARDGLHVVYGPNEAGKSTTLRALLALLFGVPKASGDAFLHGKELRVAGTMGRDGLAPVRVVRRRGTTKSLLDDAGKPLDPGLLDELLGGLDEATYRACFGLDHESLRRGADELVRGRGALGEALFDAALAGSSARKLAGELDAEAKDIWKARGENPALNAALKALADARASKERAETSAEKVAEQRAGLEAEEARAARARAELERVKAEATRLSNALARGPEEARRAALLAERASLGDVPVLGERAAEERIEATGALREALGRLSKLEARLGPRHAPTDVPTDAPTDGDDDLLDDADELRARLGRHAVDREALAAAQAERDAARSELDRRLRQAGAAAAPAADPTLEARATALFRERAALLEARAAAVRDEDRARSALAEAPDVAPFDGDDASLAAVAAPAAEDVDVLVAAVDDREAERRTAETEVERLKAALARRERERRALAAAGLPPSADELAAARAGRDRAIDAAFGTGDEPARAAARRAIGEADALADRLRLEADAVARRARLDEDLALATLDVEAAVDAAARASARATAARDALTEAFAGVLSAAATTAPRALRAWLDRRARRVERARAVTRAERERAARDAALDAWRARFEELATRAGLPADVDEDEAEALLAIRRELLAASDRCARAEDALAAPETRVRAFATAVHALADGRGLSSQTPPDELARALLARHDEATRRAAAAARDAAERARLEADRDEALERKARAEAALAELLRRARAADPDELPAVEDRVARAREIERDLRAVEQRLAGLPPADPALEGVAREELEARRARLELEEDARLEELRSAERAAGGLRGGLAYFGPGDAAARAAEEAAAHAARARELARAWAVRTVAARVFAGALEALRARAEKPTLELASGYFAHLSGGAFTRLRASFDEGDEATLVCVRADGGVVEPTGLSEGTRDQLYLALRLASLARHVEARGAMPVLLDDVLVHFDDARSARALELFADLAKRTQVVLFTHHAHVVQLARDVVPEPRLTVHALAPRRQDVPADAASC